MNQPTMMMSNKLSLGGMFLASKRPLPIDSQVRITASTPVGQVVLLGKVTAAADRRQTNHPGFEVRFSAMTDFTRRQLTSLITQANYSPSTTVRRKKRRTTEVELAVGIPPHEVTLFHKLRRTAKILRRLPLHERLGVPLDAPDGMINASARHRMHQFDSGEITKGSGAVRRAAITVRQLLDEARNSLTRK